MPGTPPSGPAVAAAYKRYIPDAQAAGFSGISLITIMAIAFAESRLDPAAVGQQDPRDRGILQINSYWHPEVSDTCAFSPPCAFKEAYRISQQGKNFSQWNTYKNRVPNYTLGVK